MRITRKKESRGRRARDGWTTRFRRNSSRRKKHDTHDLLISPLTKIMFVHRIASKKSLLLNRTIRSLTSTIFIQNLSLVGAPTKILFK